MTQTAAIPEVTWGDMFDLLNFASYSPLTVHALTGTVGLGWTDRGSGVTPGRPPGFAIPKTSESVCAQKCRQRVVGGQMAVPWRLSRSVIDSAVAAASSRERLGVM